jgi:hypothetical protein
MRIQSAFENAGIRFFDNEPGAGLGFGSGSTGAAESVCAEDCRVYAVKSDSDK